MQDFVASGRVVDVILVIMAIEAAALIAYRRMTGGGLTPSSVLLTLAPGALLLLALRAALTSEAWFIIVAWLVAALLAHLADLWSRH